MKSLRSPLAIATAALMATPTATGQPMQLTPPAETQTAASAAEAAAPPAEESSDSDGALRGATPLPPDLAVAAREPQAPPPAAVSPPPPPPAPPPRAAQPTAPVQQAEAERSAPAPTATVSIGATDEYTRLAFTFQNVTTVTPLMQGSRLDLRFSRAADMDIAELRAAPPRLVREIRRVSADGAPVRLQLTLDPGVRQRHFVDGNRVIIDLLAPAPEVQANTDAARAAGQEPAPAPAAPPVRGTGRVQLVEGANETRIDVTWPAPARAAAFRRGEAIWLLFDAVGNIDLNGVARAGRRHQDVEVVRGEGVIGVRIPAPPDVLVSARAHDNTWSFTLGARATGGERAELMRQIESDGRAEIRVRFGRDGAVRWINDPEIGDRIAVALIGGPARGVDMRRATVEAAVLPSAHGAVVEPRADGVTLSFAQGSLIVNRGAGLLATAAAEEESISRNAALIEATLNGDPAVAAQPGMTLVDVRERIDELTRRAAAEGLREGGPYDAHMELARFLLQNEFAAEALGALRMVAVSQGELAEINPEFRLLRGAANVMMGRHGAAEADLGASTLRTNATAALWRGYAATLRKDWALARQEFERGMAGLEEHPPVWRARFQLALAEAALELNDHATAEAAANAATGQAPDQNLRLKARLVLARVAAARGDSAGALATLDELVRSPDEEVAVRASVEGIRVRRMTGVIRAVDAIEPLEALRFRWRGDSTELAVVSMLGDAYSELGRWREALATMRVAADRFPADPAARQLRADMVTLFERLFLDGEADQLEPIQALGLFYEFSDLTPVGPNGDRIVRLLAGRLVHVDLLEQAATLLQHQVNERLHGVSKAQVAADLAAIYLMDHKPDQALVALTTTRQPNMPQTLLADRRILEARALLDLGRLDAAVELVERDRSEDAQRVRAEAAWRARDWPRAAAELRSVLASRSRAQPLDDHGRVTVLRAAVALTLAGNDDAVRALYREYAGDLANTPQADAFEVVASGVHAEGAAIRDVARAVARTDLLGRFMQRLRDGMTAEAQQASVTQTTAVAPAAQTRQPAPRPTAAAPDAGA